VRVPDRHRVQAELRTFGIQTGVHYPVPCHLQPPLHSYAREWLPIAEQAADEVLSLPLFPHMTRHQVDAVCAALEVVLFAGVAAGKAGLWPPMRSRADLRHAAQYSPGRTTPLAPPGYRS
jgi:DegT/DnrJ/EryC1/StrS aminotransferase family